MFAHVFKLDLKESVLWSRLEVGIFQGLYVSKFQDTLFKFFPDDIASLEHSIAQASWVDSGTGARVFTHELDMAVTPLAPFLKNLRKRRVARQDRGGLVGWSGSEVVTRLQAVHALVKGGLVDSVPVGQLDHFFQVPSTGGLGLLENKVPTSSMLQNTDLD